MMIIMTHDADPLGLGKPAVHPGLLVVGAGKFRLMGLPTFSETRKRRLCDPTPWVQVKVLRAGKDHALKDRQRYILGF